jgi:RNA polymerase sigma-70 factor (ECF subfamily)
MAESGIDTPDEILVVAAMVGDLGAFDTLVMRYRQGVVRAAQAIVGREDAEDIAQEALLLAFKALPSLEEPSRFPAWLRAITRHRAYRFDRGEKVRRREQVGMDEMLLESVPALTRSVSDLISESELESVLNGISQDHALVLRLHFLDEMPLRRIAAFLGVPLTTVKWRVHRGKELMRKTIQERLRKERQWTMNRNLKN